VKRRKGFRKKRPPTRSWLDTNFRPAFRGYPVAGTGNEFGDCNSNVVKLYSTLIIDGKQQVGYYHPGVGTMGAPTAHNKISKAWSIVMGLAFGAGLLANVGDAYRYLMNVFEDGDRVFIFGLGRQAGQEDPKTNLEIVAKQYGLKPGELDQAIRVWGAKTSEPYEVGRIGKSKSCVRHPSQFSGGVQDESEMRGPLSLTVASSAGQIVGSF
jgi:hypothetical protein